MMENKNIDRLFQDKMEGMEVTPGPKVWSAIESKLQKKKRRVLPYWWLSGSVAALFIIGLFLFPQIEDNPSNLDTVEGPIITNVPKEKTTIKTDSSKQFLNVVPEEKIVIAEKKSSDKDNNQRKKATHKQTTSKEKTVIADNTVINNTNVTGNNTITDFTNKAEKLTESLIKEKPLDEKRKSITKKNPADKMLIAEHKTDSVKKKVPFPKKDFIATLNEINKKDDEEKSLKKWSLSTVFAVLNSNSFTKSSPIARELSANPAEGGNTFSYGVKVAYQVADKWSFQSGVHLQKMDYLTKDIAITSGVDHGNLQTVRFNNVSSEYYFSYAGLNLSSVGMGASASRMSNSGQLEQSFSYIEIPLEVKYHFIEGKKLKTSVVAGFSTLFLTNNEIKVQVPDFPQMLGEANNLNSVNFSGNLGLDIDYSINKKWTLNLNPMFKNQFNTFSNSANGFRPYYIGIYTGVKYQF